MNNLKILLMTIAAVSIFFSCSTQPKTVQIMPRSFQATFIESTTTSEVMIKATGKGYTMGEAELDAKKAAIEAAMQRVKSKRSQQQVTPKNTDNLTDDQKRAIAEADERRARLRATKDAPESSNGGSK